MTGGPDWRVPAARRKEVDEIVYVKGQVIHLVFPEHKVDAFYRIVEIKENELVLVEVD